MAVPAWDVAGFFAMHQLNLVDDVFEGLVEGMAHVQGPIGIGRPVVEGKNRPWVLAAQAVVEIQFSPEPLQFRFPLARVGAHREIGFEQIEGVFVRGLARAHQGSTSAGDYPWRPSANSASTSSSD